MKYDNRKTCSLSIIPVITAKHVYFIIHRFDQELQISKVHRGCLNIFTLIGVT